MNMHAVLGTDFSKAVAEIIENSEMFKTFGINKISLVHVLNLRDVIMIEKFTIEGLEKKLEDQKNILINKGFDVTARLIYGIPHLELEKIRKEEKADIIIAGSHGRTYSSSTIGGTITEVLQNIKAPVMLIPMEIKSMKIEDFSSKNLYQYEYIMKQLEKQEPDCSLKCKNLTDHVLLATDFSDFSEKAFQWIRNCSAKFKKLSLLHVQDEVKIGKHLEHKLDEFNTIDTERLNRLKASFQQVHPETAIDINVEYGKPTQVILNFIQKNKVTLTVMGSQGRGFFEEIFIGSVSHQVARKANSNILIIPIQKD